MLVSFARRGVAPDQRVRRHPSRRGVGRDRPGLDPAQGTPPRPRANFDSTWLEHLER